MSRLTDRERRIFYGQPGQVPTKTVLTPWGIKVVKHVLIADLWLDACHQAAADCAWRPRRIDGYVHRNIRGSSEVSIHSYALADDFFATDPGVPPPGGVWKPDNTVPPDFARCFTERGFTWGADFDRRPDYPHIEWAGAPPKGKPWRGSGHDEDSRVNKEKPVYHYRLTVPNHPDKGKVFLTDLLTKRYVDDTAEGDFLTALMGAPKENWMPAQLHDSLKLVKAA